MARYGVWICVLSLIHQVAILYASHIEINPDGGYNKIVVAIPSREKQSVELLENLKEFLTEASKSFQAATKNHAFFNEIQILLPNSWYNDTFNKYKIATFESHSEADIRIDSFNPLPEKGYLYTHQPRGCGEKGDYIYLNPEFVNNWRSSNSSADVRKFVQEWSKFRYGIFDEYGYGNELYPETYINQNKTTETTGCKSPSNLSISIMDRADLKSENFCDGTSSHHHNYHAPTPQNNLCNLKSTWDVIKNSLDLKNIKPNPNNPGIPTISIVKASPMQVVFVIDPSLFEKFGTKGSHMLELTLRQFEAEFPPNGKIGFVVANEQSDRTNLENRNNHLEHLKALLQNVAVNKTTFNIKAGVEKGIDMIKQTSHFGHLIFISDGLRLKSTDFQSVFKDPLKLKFFLITWTPEKTKLQYASVEQMKEFVNNPSRYIWSDIRVATSVSNCDTKARIQIEDALGLFYSRFGNEDFYPKKIKIYEDSDIAALSLNSFVSPLPQAKLIFTCYVCEANGDDKRVALNINNKNIDGISTDKMLSSLSITHTETVLSSDITYTWTIWYPQKLKPTSSVWLDFDNIIKPEVILAGQFEKNYLKSNVPVPWKFFAFSPNKHTVDLNVTTLNKITTIPNLRDNGNGDPDVMANDGIYSRYFLDVDSTDWYSFRLIGKNEKGNAVSLINIGSFYLQPLDQSQMPPNRIADYRISKVDAGTVTLKWTAPGDIYDQGAGLFVYGALKNKINASDYYMINSTDFKDVANVKFVKESSTLLSDKPQKSGEVELLNWTPPKSDEFYYCVITSINTNGIVGEMSNIVTVYISPKDTGSTPDESKFPIEVIIGISVAIGAVILIIFGAVYFYVRIKQNSNNRQPYQVKISYSAEKGVDIIRHPSVNSSNLKDCSPNKETTTDTSTINNSNNEYYYQVRPLSPSSTDNDDINGGFSSEWSSTRKMNPKFVDSPVNNCISQSILV